jgi:hypothetical protein
MKASGLLKIIPGDGGGTSKGRLTRFCALPKLLELARTSGVAVADWSAHFTALPRPKEIPQPLALKSSSAWIGGMKRDGATIPIDLGRSPPRELAEQVNSLNRFFAAISIEPAESHHAFRRIFNQGDDPSFDWNKGGRLYSLGESYQQMKPNERRMMKLNGEPVVELDIRASHLTILHALVGEPFHQRSDPYNIRGLPRSVVKAWVAMTLGHDRFQRCWSKDCRADFAEEFGKDLQKEHPIRAVREKVLDHLPVLKAWPSCSLRWGDLQYQESEVVVGAVYTLAMRHNVPALPVHDSIIVPAPAQKLAEEVLSSSFHKKLGVRPFLRAK